MSNEFLQWIKEKQPLEKHLLNITEMVEDDQRGEFNKGDDEMLRLEERVCIPRKKKISKMIFDVGHKSNLSFYSGEMERKKCIKI